MSTRDVFYISTGNTGNRAGQQALACVYVIDHYTANTVLRVIETAIAISEPDEDRRSRPLHLYTCDDDTLDPSPIDHFQCNAGDHTIFVCGRIVVNYRV